MTQHPVRFEAYSTDRFIEIVKAWTGHSWPMSPEEGRRVFEDLEYRADPSDPDMFSSPFTNGTPDSFFTAQDNTIDNVLIAVANRLTTPESSNIIERTYLEFRLASRYLTIPPVYYKGCICMLHVYTDVSVHHRTHLEQTHSPLLFQMYERFP